MAHIALLDDDNFVTEVFAIPDNVTEERVAEVTGKKCKRTSYNTRGGVHMLGGTPFRKNYAGVGCRYDETLDAFIPPKPFPSWTLNSNCKWESPVPIPADFGKGDPPKLYRWNENNQVWIAVEI